MSGTTAQPPAGDPRRQNGEVPGDEPTEPQWPPLSAWPALPAGQPGELGLPPGTASWLLPPPSGSAPTYAQPSPIAAGPAPSLEQSAPRENPWRGSRLWTMLIVMVSLVLLMVCAVPIWGFGLWSAWAGNSHAQPPVVARLDPGGRGASETAWSPDGRYLAEQVTLAGGTADDAQGSAVVLWDVQTRQEVRRFTGATGGLAAAWAPDGAWLATTDGRVTLLWRAAEVEVAGTGVTPVARLQAPDKNEAITDLAWGQDGLTLAVVDEGGLEIWQQTNGAGWKQIKYVQDGACATILCGRRLLRSPDGHWLLVAPWHGKDGASGVGVWDMQTWRQEPLLHASTALAWSPDSSLVVVRNADETTLSAVRVGGWAAAWTINPNKDLHQSYRVYPQAAGWSPDGEWLVGSMDGWVDLWPTDTQQSAWVWQEQEPGEGVYVVTSLAWSPDGRMLAVTTDGLARVTLYDLSHPSPPASGPPGF